MGQYQEWLHYQELDRQLRGQLQSLETKLIELQNQVYALQKKPHAKNPLVLALTQYFMHQNTSAETPAASSFDLPSTAFLESAPTFSVPPTPTVPPISSQTADWLATGFTPKPTENQAQLSNEPPAEEPQQVIPPLFSLPVDPAHTQAPTPEQQAQMLSEAFGINGSNAASNSSASLEIPDWLQHISVATNQGYMPIDPESVRTNRLVQRWLTRWGKQTPPESPSQSPEEQTHE